MATTILIIVLSVAAGLVLLYLAFGAFMFGQTLSRKAAGRGMNTLSDEDVLLGKEGAMQKRREQQTAFERLVDRIAGDASGLGDFYDKPYFPSFLAGLQWFFANHPQKVTTGSPRGMRLHADVFLHEKTPSNVWFVCIHGYSSSPRDFGGLAKVVHEDWGCNVLLPYLGAHGRSEGKHISMGWLDRLDIVAWTEYLVREHGEDVKIVLLGNSMGAATTMMTTGETLPPNVVCAVADCGYTSFWDEYVVQAKVILGLPPFPGVYALNTMVKWRMGFSMKEASSVEQLKKSKTPTLFIHGDADAFVPFWMQDLVYEACAAEKQKLAVPGAGHSESHYQEELYYGTVKEFVGRYLPGFARETVAR